MKSELKRRVEKLEQLDALKTGSGLEPKLRRFAVLAGVDYDLLAPILKERGLEGWLNTEMNSEGQVTWPVFVTIRDLCSELRKSAPL